MLTIHQMQINQYLLLKLRLLQMPRLQVPMLKPILLLTLEPITSWDAMFDPKYADQVLMINNSRDALGIALMDLNYSVNTDSEEELRAAYDLLAQAKEAGVYQAFVMDEVFDKMETGEAAISAYYAGDYLTMLETNPDLKYVVPEEGSNWFVDAMCRCV